MFLFAFFILSGLGLVALVWSKNYEEKRGKTPFILRAVSKGDEYVRDYHHHAIHFYAEGRDKVVIFVTKQLPLRAKNLWYKSLAYIEEKAKDHLSNMRDTKLMKRPDGISEFFKNISEIEKGTGEINEEFIGAVEATVSIPEPEVVNPEVPAVAQETEAPKRRGRKRKVPVVEEL